MRQGRGDGWRGGAVGQRDGCRPHGRGWTGRSGQTSAPCQQWWRWRKNPEIREEKLRLLRTDEDGVAELNDRTARCRTDCTQDTGHRAHRAHRARDTGHGGERETRGNNGTPDAGYDVCMGGGGDGGSGASTVPWTRRRGGGTEVRGGHSCPHPHIGTADTLHTHTQGVVSPAAWGGTGNGAVQTVSNRLPTWSLVRRVTQCLGGERNPKGGAKTRHSGTQGAVTSAVDATVGGRTPAEERLWRLRRRFIVCLTTQQTH